MFPIYKIDTDKTIESKGTKEKYWVSLNGQKALIKINRYENNNDVRSYNVSEKIFSEIAKILKFSCVDTDFIVDENKHYGIASFDYKTNNDNIILSGDDLFFSALNRFPTKNAKNNIVPEDYTYENIVKILSHYDNSYELQKKFNKIMIMDALTGEQDRHYENWGICLSNGKYELLPMYDNSCCLLYQFRDNNIREREMNKKDIKEYSFNSKCKVSVEGKLYKHFDFVDYLIDALSPDLKNSLINDIKKLSILTDERVKNIVMQVPDELCDEQQKNLILKYIIVRRDILLSKVG